MKKSVIVITGLFLAYQSTAQGNKISGIVLDTLTNQPVYGATIILNPGSRMETTDERGRFGFQSISSESNRIIISAIGFQSKTFLLSDWKEIQVIKLSPKETVLSDIVLTTGSKSPYKALAETDIAMRGVANSQEVLRMVPGLFIGQHQGGGKAEQIFLRGFDADHGSDISISADGIPVNLVSHAHAQGYADSHFIIPETIDRAIFNKGPYDIEKGDQATSGYLDFVTINAVSNNTLKIEAGQFQTYRALAMIDLLGSKAKVKKQSWYAASEYSFSNSYFEDPEHFKRFNLFTKLNYQLSATQLLTVSLSTFRSSWFACGQIPERAVETGLIGYYGALDPNEGGITSRTNINILLRTSLPKAGVLKNQFYYSRYQFDLHSNFTFFLVDTVNGDEIRQREKRNLFGYRGSYTHEDYLGNVKMTMQSGVDVRLDATFNSELSHTRDRYTLLNLQKLGDITEWGTSFYISETARFNEKWTLKGGLRFDNFNYRYDNKFAADHAFEGVGTFKAHNHIFSPKINLYYQVSPVTQLYFSLGRGFHTNDARVVVTESGRSTLPRADAADLGFIYKPVKRLLIHAAAWYIQLQKEYVYAGDGGTVEFSGRTQRLGVDLSARYQPAKPVFIDVDVNYAHGRAMDEVKGNNYIPLAPVWSSSAGISYINKTGWNASLRYRYLSARPANADYSLICQGYFVNDLVIKHKEAHWEYGVIINNLFNVKWRETQFETLTRLKHEPSEVNDITFTPGTKFAAKLTLSYFFTTKTIHQNGKNKSTK